MFFSWSCGTFVSFSVNMSKFHRKKVDPSFNDPCFSTALQVGTSNLQNESSSAESFGRRNSRRSSRSSRSSGSHRKNRGGWQGQGRLKRISSMCVDQRSKGSIGDLRETKVGLWSRASSNRIGLLHVLLVEHLIYCDVFHLCEPALHETFWNISRLFAQRQAWWLPAVFPCARGSSAGLSCTMY